MTCIVCPLKVYYARLWQQMEIDNLTSSGQAKIIIKMFLGLSPLVMFGFSVEDCSRERLIPNMIYHLGHRFDDSKGMRRRKISHHTASVVHIGHVKKVKTAPVLPRRLQSEQQLQHHKVAPYVST